VSTPPKPNSRGRAPTGREAFIERMLQEAEGPTVTLRTCFGTPYEVTVQALQDWLDDRIPAAHRYGARASEPAVDAER
jgi:hypothetical protein